MIKAVLFDCFGVLVNDGLQGIVDELERSDPATAHRIVDTVTLALQGSIDADVSRHMVASLLGLTLAGYNQRIRQAETKNQVLLDYILTLRPKYKTGIVSNILPGGLRTRFSSDELERYFDIVIGSGDIGYAKPDVRIYQIAAEKAGVETYECTFIDDRQVYLDGARAAGMAPILYASFIDMERQLRGLGVRSPESDGAILGV